MEQKKWALIFAPQLTVKVQQAYAVLNVVDDAVKYEEVKMAISKRYIIEETYRQRYRCASKN